MVMKIELEADIDTVEGRVPTKEEVTECIVNLINGFYDDNPIGIKDKTTFYVTVKTIKGD